MKDREARTCMLSCYFCELWHHLYPAEFQRENRKLLIFSEVIGKVHGLLTLCLFLSRVKRCVIGKKRYLDVTVTFKV